MSARPFTSNAVQPEQTQRIALVCDWLTTPGGAEKVLLELHRLYPMAPIYTSQYNRKGIDWFSDADVRTGWLQIFPAGLRKFLGPLRQIYFSHLDLSGYDYVISVTGAEAKAVRTKSRQTGKRAQHICYCHVPTQYYWQMYDRYLENPGFGILNPLVRLGFKLLVKPLRRADYQAAQQPDQFVTISTYAQEQIQKYYQRKAIVVAPPVEVKKFTFHQKDVAHYYIIACRQVNWKRVDLAVSACKKLHLPLLVVGDGPERAKLLALAGESEWIKFLPWAATTELAQYLQGAKGYIFPSLEPFGIAAVEALAAGCPVIAFAQGGSQDFIENGVNGLLFDQQTTKSLVQALKRFEQLKFDRAIVAKTAVKFSTVQFDRKIRAILKKGGKKHENLA